MVLGHTIAKRQRLWSGLLLAMTAAVLLADALHVVALKSFTLLMSLAALYVVGGVWWIFAWAAPGRGWRIAPLFLPLLLPILATVTGIASGALHDEGALVLVPTGIAMLVLALCIAFAAIRILNSGRDNSTG